MRALVQPSAVLLGVNQFVEDGQHLFAIVINALQVVVEARLKAARLQPFFEKIARHVDITAQRLRRVAAEKKAIEHCRFPLRG